MLGYCILTFPWLVPPDTNHSFIKTSNQLNKKQNLSKTDQCVAIYILRILLVSQIFWNIMKIREIGISTSSKNNQLKISFSIGMKNNFVSAKFCLFQQDQTTITKTSHKGFTWHKHKKKNKEHNHNRITMVWTQQNKKQKAKINSLGCLPTSAIV